MSHGGTEERRGMDRRTFLIAAAGGVVSAAAIVRGGERVADKSAGKPKAVTTMVALVRTADRAAGIRRAIALLRINPVQGKDVLLKPNFNTADPFPGYTHNETLTQLVLQLRSMGAKGITIGERSGPPDTADVLKDKGIAELCKQLGVGLIDFETLPPGDWVRIKPEQSNWRNGFEVARPVLESPCVVTTCCLKTHAYGGVFTLSLKLSVGITILKELGSNPAIMEKKIFDQEQISRAVELGLGVSRPQDLGIATDDGEGRQYAECLRKILEQG